MSILTGLIGIIHLYVFTERLIPELGRASKKEWVETNSYLSLIFWSVVHVVLAIGIITSRQVSPLGQGYPILMLTLQITFTAFAIAAHLSRLWNNRDSKKKFTIPS